MSDVRIPGEGFKIATLRVKEAEMMNVPTLQFLIFPS
jgi:hypothetical protein